VKSQFSLFIQHITLLTLVSRQAPEIFIIASKQHGPQATVVEASFLALAARGKCLVTVS
jgi:hypothetical protein